MATKSYEDIERDLVQMQINALDKCLTVAKKAAEDIKPNVLPANRLNSEAANLISRIVNTSEQHVSELESLKARLQSSLPPVGQPSA